MGQAPDFFVSYTSTDRAWAEWIAWQLEAEGYQVVLQAWDFGPGLDWAHEMQHAITTAERVMAVLSTAYLESAHGEAEWLAFYARDPSGERGLLLPIRVDEVEPPGLLKSRVYVDLVGRDASSALAALLAAARGARGKPTEAPEFPGDRWLSVSASEAPRFPGESPTVRNVKVDPKNANPLLPVSESSQLLEHFTAAVRSYCVAIPSWFPDRLGFSQVKQQVSVTPPQVRGASPREKERNLRISAPEERPREEQEGASTSMRVSLDAALRQYQRLVIVGDPGVGKSWALRGLALSLLPASEEPEPEDDAAPLPFVALAPKLDSILQGGHIDDLSYRQIADALVRSMPDAVASRLSDAERLDLAARIADGRSLAVFIDGYDEVRSDQPALARALPAIEAFCLNTNSLFALTTRPSNVPPRATTSLGWCTIEPFANREQSTFIHGWFAGDKALARRLTSWVRAHRLEVMRVPLMLSLFCSVVEQGGQPPSTEHELWERALLRLAAEQDRFGEISPVGEHTRLRLTVLEHVAESFIGEGLRETVPISEIEGRLRAHEDWVALAAQLRTTSVMEDLLNTGIVQKASTGMHTDLVFLHSALRDYLIARVLARTGSWHDKLSKTWRHPEWEPVIGYLGALLDDPSELVSQLTTLFDDDPLNIARLVAGRALSAIGEGQLPAYIGSRVRDEILVLLTSNDVWDRLRASTLLPVMNVDGTTDLLRGLLNASVPTQVIVAAIGALAGNLSEPVQGTLYSVVNSDWFTTAEREAAVNAIADTGTEEALTRITDISADVHLPPGVRVAAAIAAWRSFDVDQLTLDILSNGEEDPTVQRPLSERLAVESEKAEMLARFISDGVLSVPDGYSRAVLLAAAQPGSISTESIRQFSNHYQVIQLLNDSSRWHNLRFPD
jgi:TIR domain